MDLKRSSDLDLKIAADRQPNSSLDAPSLLMSKYSPSPFIICYVPRCQPFLSITSADGDGQITAGKRGREHWADMFLAWEIGCQRELLGFLLLANVIYFF